MAFRKEDNVIVEYRTIPTHDEEIRRLTIKQFEALKTNLTAEIVTFDAKKVADAILLQKQVVLDELTKVPITTKSGQVS